MTTAVAEKRTEHAQKVQPTISWEAFQRRYLTREDAFKYEWVNGFIEKTPRSMDNSQLFIYRNLLRFFLPLQAQKKFDGVLSPEIDALFSGNHRRPDIAFYTDEQVEKARTDPNVSPDFVVEVLSKTDQVNRVERKMEDYRRTKVKIVWLIFPEKKVVHVYHGKKMTVCTGDDLCSAEPVIDGFLMPASDIFK